MNNANLDKFIEQLNTQTLSVKLTQELLDLIVVVFVLFFFLFNPIFLFKIVIPLLFAVIKQICMAVSKIEISDFITNYSCENMEQLIQLFIGFLPVILFFLFFVLILFRLYIPIIKFAYTSLVKYSLSSSFNIINGVIPYFNVKSNVQMVDTSKIDEQVILKKHKELLSIFDENKLYNKSNYFVPRKRTFNPLIFNLSYKGIDYDMYVYTKLTKSCKQNAWILYSLPFDINTSSYDYPQDKSGIIKFDYKFMPKHGRKYVLLSKEYNVPSLYICQNRKDENYYINQKSSTKQFVISSIEFYSEIIQVAEAIIDTNYP